MEAGGGEAEEDIARANVGLRENPVPLDRADGESSEIVVVCRWRDGRGGRGSGRLRPLEIRIRPAVSRVDRHMDAPPWYMLGISAVSPPIRAHPACTHPSAMPLTTRVAVSTSSLLHAK